MNITRSVRHHARSYGGLFLPWSGGSRLRGLVEDIWGGGHSGLLWFELKLCRCLYTFLVLVDNVGLFPCCEGLLIDSSKAAGLDIRCLASCGGNALDINFVDLLMDMPSVS